MIDYAVNDQIVRIGNDKYPLCCIKDIYVIKLDSTAQFLRQIYLGIQFSLVGWLSSLWIGGTAAYLAFALFALGIAYGIVTFRNFELRAKFFETDESGDQTIPILHANNDDQLEAIFNIYNSVKSRILKRL